MVEVEEVSTAREILISKSQTLLKIQANQNDPIIFQIYFCTTCQQFIFANGLFPRPEQHPVEHPLVWLPAVDYPAPDRPRQAIIAWLLNKPLSAERRRFLSEAATTSNSMCWALLIEPEERDEWFEYLWNYLDDLAESWLQALNGFDTPYFRASEIWLRPRPPCNFNWDTEETTN